MRQIKLTRMLTSLIAVVVMQEIYHISRCSRRCRSATSVASVTSENERVDGGSEEVKYDFAGSPMARDFRVTKVDCNKIINGHPGEIDTARNVTVDELPEVDTDISIYMELRHSCVNFKRRRGYILHHLTDEERDFPIAVSLLLFKDFHQVERLMRSMYRPQNSYCLHVDFKADPQVRAVVRAYADCFANVLVPRDSVKIKWGTFSIAEAELVCMYELSKYKRWKYFINLTGQEFPLKTNRQIVKILKKFNGSNDVWISPMRAQGRSFRIKFIGQPPHGIHLVKGSASIILSRPFVEFVMNDGRVADLATYLARTGQPEETLWTSLNIDPSLHAPGGFNGTLIESIREPFIARERWWRAMKKNCTGRYTRDVCIFGVADIHRLARARPIVVNKFYWDRQPMALACLQEWMFNRTRDEYLGRYTFDVSRYENLPNARKMFRTPT